LTDYNDTLIYTKLNEGLILLAQINQTSDNIYTLLASVNVSIYNAIYDVQNTLIPYLVDIQNNISDVQTELAVIRVITEEVNATLYDGLESIDDRFDDIESDISDLDTLIDNVNISVMNKLYLMQDEIASVNQSVLDAETNILDKLDEIQLDVISINDTLILYLMNITNITANITFNQEELLYTLIAIWGEDIGNGGNYQMAGFTGLLTGGVNEVQYFCSDNTTLSSVRNELVNVSGRLIPIERTVDIPCTYGCVENACALPDFAVYGFLMLGLILLFIGYRFYMSRED
jgi:hypothetical protein